MRIHSRFTGNLSKNVKISTKITLKMVLSLFEKMFADRIRPSHGPHAARRPRV